MLEWFADAPDPDAGLFGFRRISEALGSTPWYLRLLRDEGEAAQRMAQVLATSRYATDLLQREPEGVAILGEDERLEPLSREAVQAEMTAAAERRDDAKDAVLAIRAVRRRELLRISVADLCVPFGVAEVGYALTDVTSATLEATLAAVIRGVEAARGEQMPTRMAIVAMGRYGGYELGYGSDADVMFVHDPLPGADAQLAASMAQAVANDVRRLLTEQARDPALEVDAGLRPEGRQGPLVRTLDSYAAYYGKWSAVWEAQALLRAAPIVGDPDLCERFTELIDPLRFPEEGLSHDDVVEVRRIKARVDSERLPRGADPATHFKLGRGGLSDVEWTVQLLQMQHAGRIPELRTTKTLEALQVAVEHDLLDLGRRRGPGRGVAVRQPRAQRDRPGARQAGRPAASRRPRAGGGGGDPAVRAGGVRRDGQRLPALGPPGAGDRGPDLLGMKPISFISAKISYDLHMSTMKPDAFSGHAHRRRGAVARCRGPAGAAHRLAELLDEANAALRPVVPLRITVGDEFQGCFATVGEALHATLWLRLHLAPAGRAAPRRRLGERGRARRRARGSRTARAGGRPATRSRRSRPRRARPATRHRAHGVPAGRRGRQPGRTRPGPGQRGADVSGPDGWLCLGTVAAAAARHPRRAGPRPSSPRRRGSPPRRSPSGCATTGWP